MPWFAAAATVAISERGERPCDYFLPRRKLSPFRPPNERSERAARIITLRTSERAPSFPHNLLSQLGRYCTYLPTTRLSRGVSQFRHDSSPDRDARHGVSI